MLRAAASFARQASYSAAEVVRTVRAALNRAPMSVLRSAVGQSSGQAGLLRQESLFVLARVSELR
jgi:hypothetical protein